jgi:PAS domain S-box-containing protein
MSLNYKRLFRWLPWLSSLGLAIVFVLFMLADLDAHRQVWNERLQWNAQTQQEYVKSTGRDLSQQAMLLAQLVASDQRVIDQIRLAHQKFLSANQQSHHPDVLVARQNLQQLLQEHWAGITDLGGNQLNIYFSPGSVSFLRMHRPDRFGDSLNDLRPMIASTFDSGIPSSGLDVARQGSGYRAALPVTASPDKSGGVIAVIEVGMSTLPQGDQQQAAIENRQQTPIQDRQQTPIQLAVFLRKSSVEQVLWEQIRQQLNQRSPTVVDDWRLEGTTDPQLYDWWRSGRVQINQRGYLLHTGDQVYVTSWWPLDQVAVAPKQSGLAALAWTDITPAYQAYSAVRKKVMAKWTIAIVCAQLLLLGFTMLNRRFLRNLMQQYGKQLSDEHAANEQARQRLALALRSSDSGFWEWDIANEKAHFSPEWRQFCGIGPATSSSQDLDEWLSRIHPADKRLSYVDIIRHIKGETAMYENEYRLRIHDGSYKWILTRGKVVERDANGRATLMLGVYTDITERKNTELISTRQQAALHSLNEIASLSGVDAEEQLRRALHLGARYLGLSGGVVSHISGEDYRVYVQYAAQSQPNLDSFSPLGKTYCSLTIEQQDVFAEDNVPGSEYCAHPAYQHTGIESYIGAPLWISGEIYGTLAFTSRKSRQHAYDALDRDFVRLLARWISSVVERLQQDTEKKVILQRFQKLSERLPGFLYQFQRRPDGSSFFPYASPGVHNIYNVSPEDVALSANKMFAVIHPQDLPWVIDSVLESAEQLTPWVATVRVNNPVRGMIWTHTQATPERLEDGSVLWSGYVSNITPLKEAENELKETNSLRKAILDAASVAIISTDKEGVIKTFNHGAELMLGYAADEIIDRQTMELFHLPEEITARASQLTSELGYVIEPGFECFIARPRSGKNDEHEWQYLHKDGRCFPVLLTISPLRDTDGEVNGYLGIARDISELKRIDQMKAEFISTVSHELRTPLTAISGALGILASGWAGALPQQSTRMIQIAHNNSTRLIHLVNDLLDMEKLAVGKMYFDIQPQLLMPLIQQSLEANAAFAQQYGVSYELVPFERDIEVAVDHRRLLQVLANYLSNAAKFSPANDVVTVKAERRLNGVRVSVTDKGPGISEEFRARLFQKFSQADSSDTRQKGGTGLGLAICKEIIERMGGSVGADSVPGEGACFYFDLPCEEATPHSLLPQERIP